MRTVALFCGSRDWTDPMPVAADIDALPEDAIVIHGAAPGLDSMAGALASARGLHVAAMPALWSRHGRRAGPMRNAALLGLAPTVAYAYPLGASPGTRMMVGLLEKAGVPVHVRGGRDG